MYDVQVRLFGDVSVEQNSGQVNFESGRSLEMFCYLALYRDRPHRRESLSEKLWPEANPVAAKKYLRQALWRLNATTRSRLDDRGGTTELVIVDPTSVRINPGARCWVDVQAFEQTSASVRDTQGEHLSETQVKDLEVALALYRGDLLAAWYHDWCDFERDRLLLARLTMQEQLMAYCTTRGRYAEGVELGQSVLRRDPARENTHRQLMRLHYTAGDRIVGAATVRALYGCHGHGIRHPAVGRDHDPVRADPRRSGGRRGG